MIEAMGCDAIDRIADVKKHPLDECWLEPKWDGFRIIAEIEATGVLMYTRSLKVVGDPRGNLDHIAEELMATFPAGTVLDGEIVHIPDCQPDGMKKNDFEAVQSAMNSHADRSLEFQRATGKRMQFMLFDLLRYRGDDLTSEPLVHRRTQLELNFATILLDGEVVHEKDTAMNVFLTPAYKATQEEHDRLVDRGLEGSVIKWERSQYHVGKHGKGWYKCKATHHPDVVILGFTEGEGKYDGQIGAVIFGQPHFSMPTHTEKIEMIAHGGVAYVVRGQCSGMTDAQRRDFSDNRDSYIGKVMEISHKMSMAGGIKFRHPQFERMRPDKAARQVYWHDK